MKCKQCQAEGKTSTIQPLGMRSTLMWYAPFFDKDGKYHIHDDNTITNSYRCSNGHIWEVKAKNPCPECGEWWKNPPVQPAKVVVSRPA